MLSSPDQPSNVVDRPVEIRSVTKAIRLLEELAKDPGLFSVTDLARTLDMDKSSVSRMLRTLEQAGLVAQDATTLRYSLGLSLAVLGHRALKRINIRDLSRAPLEQLAAKTGECAHLAILANDRAFYVEQAAPERGVSVEAPIGTLAPLYCTALGKCLLAHQLPARRDLLIADIKFDRFTRRTIGDAGSLLTHLEGVMRNGVAYDDEEFSVGVRCIAAPVFRHDGAVSGAIGISGPSPRMTDERMASWGDLVRAEAAALSGRLGHQGAASQALAS